MGGGYSKEEKLAAEKYVIKIQKAVGDNELLEKYKKISKELSQDLSKKNGPRFCVDYIKGYIKSPKPSGRNKFLALLLLKDLMKTKKKSIVNYNNKKFLSRLFILANSNLKEKVLQTFNPKVNLEDSKKFYHLLLECFQNWGKTPSKILKYNDFYLKLIKKKRIPIPERYYNYPSDNDAFEGRVLEDLNGEEDYSELGKEVDLVRKVREEVVGKVLESPSCHLGERKQINTMMKFYKENIDNLNDNGLKRKLDNDHNEKFLGLKENINKELFFFDDFQREYKKADGYEKTIDFYDNLKELENNYFENKISVQNAKDHLRNEKIHEEEKLQEIEDKREKEKEEQEKQEEKEKENLNLEYDMNILDDQPSFVDNEDNMVYKMDYADENPYEYENNDLENSLNLLEKKKKKLESNIESIKRNQKENLTPRSHYKNNKNEDGLEKVLKKKENQIEDLENKINNIENEFKNMKNSEDYNFEFQRNSPYKPKRAYGEKSETKMRNKSASLIKSRYEEGNRGGFKGVRKNKYENSGTKFVNKMYDDVNRLLNKNGRGYRGRAY